jgi:hypothetical protein
MTMGKFPGDDDKRSNKINYYKLIMVLKIKTMAAVPWCIYAKISLAISPQHF